MKEQFFVKLAGLVALAKDFPTAEFDEAAPEEVTKRRLIEPFFHALGYKPDEIVGEYRIIGDSVDYLVRTGRPLLFIEAKALIDPAPNLFEAHRQQVQRYVRNYRISPQQAEMERPVTWILLTNFAQFHFLRVNEDAPTFTFRLDELISRRDELWELLAPECLEADRIEELYDQTHKAPLDQRFLADLKRWRLLLANGFAMRNQTRPLADLKLASQQLLDRFLFCRMLETHRLLEHNRLARAFAHYEALFGEQDQEKTFAEVLRESLFAEIKRDFNTELFLQPLLCDELPIDNLTIATAIGHEPLHIDLAAHCGLDSGQGQLLPFKHLYGYDFSRMSQDVMGSVYERFLAHNLSQDGGRIVIEDTDELRKKEGIYYTPQYIVDYIVEHTLGEKIKPVLAEAKTLLGYKNYPAAIAKIRELQNVSVLDPAMGSGSFLLRAFDKLVSAYADYNAECRRVKRERNGGGSLFDADFAVAEEVLDAPLHVLTENIHGVDLDAQAVEVAKLSLWLRYMAVNRDSFRERLRDRRKGGKPLNLLPTLTRNLKRGNSLIADKAIAGDAAFDWGKEFPGIMGSARVSRAESGVAPDSSKTQNISGNKSEEGSVRRDAEHCTPEACAPQHGFDVVIGNPPYERIQTMQANAPQAAEFLKANYRSAASGNFDIYICFIERGLQLLNANGLFGYICPHKFFEAEYGIGLRSLLSDGKHIRGIVSFGHQLVFSQASTYTCLLFLNKVPVEQCRLVKVDDLEAWREGKPAPEGNFPAAHFTAGAWNFALGAGAAILQTLSKMPVKLADVTDRIFQGIKTSADDIYIVEELERQSKKVRVFSPETQKEHWLEPDLLHPLVKGGDSSRYSLTQTIRLILFPYAPAKSGDMELIPEAKLQKKFPLTWDYLVANQKRLEAREDGKMAGENWHGYGRIQALDVMPLPKIFTPDLSEGAAYSMDETGESFFTGGVAGGYGILVKPDISREFILGLLNSRLLEWFIQQTSTPMRGGWFSFESRFIRHLPIKQIDPKAKSEAKLEKEIVERVEQIQAAHRQRVKLPEVLSRLIAHTQNRTPCNLAHYLQKDFAAAVKTDILIDDVQRAGFVHEISIASDGKELTLTANVADKATDEPRPLPVLRLTFKDDALRQFIYAGWRQFLAEHSRQKKWTKGKKGEPIYPLLVNTLEPLVYFAPAAGDNLRVIRDLMKAVAEEAGSADLAALEAEIAKLDREIDARVYELYGLTEDEIKIVEGRAVS